MLLPAPAPLAAQPTVALGCIGRNFPAEAVRAARENGVAPVLMHHLAGEDGSGDDGPREILAATAAALENAGHTTAWGAGCAVRSSAEAAACANAGFTWFSFELGNLIDSRADSMSLDELDAAIVALEDAGIFARGWHDHFLDRAWTLGSGRVLRLADETLARAAVKYGRAFAEAAQWQQAMRTLWTGRGSAPDLELNFAGRRDRWNADEFLFLALEAARRGLCPACLSPALGSAWQPGADFEGGESAIAATLAQAGEIAALAGSLKVGLRFAAGKSRLPEIAARTLGPRAHLNFEEDSWLASLATLAREQPDLFRGWLSLAQELFPFAASGQPLAITEEDTHALPQVGDADLPATFLGDLRGRQLLLSTFPEVLRRDRALREALSAAPTPR